ncbi:NAD(P)H-binding protein [Virgisporangium aurantiacum]
MTTTVVVTGATGRVGRHVVAGLRAAGADVRALSRRPKGGHVTGDLADPESLDSAAARPAGASLMCPFFGPDAAPAVVAAIARHAKRIVLLSSGSVDGGVPGAEPIARFHAEVERAVEVGAPSWTVLRPAGFAANTLDWAPSIREDGVVRGAFPDAAGAWIHEKDIAAVAVKALLADGHRGRHYALTGPEVLTMAEQAHIIGAVTGRPVRWQKQSEDDARAGLTAEGWPATYADVALRVQEQLTRARPATTATVADITGRRPRTFREWAGDHAAAFLP